MAWDKMSLIVELSIQMFLIDDTHTEKHSDSQLEKKPASAVSCGSAYSECTMNNVLYRYSTFMLTISLFDHGYYSGCYSCYYSCFYPRVRFLHR